jgi:uncharacterized membrane protein YeaQ/YmgE (transglycosylase-associated protein family)
MNWIVFLIVGGVIGWLASLVMRTNAQMGLLANIIVGIIGSMLGAWLAPRLGIAPAGMGVYLVAIGGAVLLILLLKVLGIFR